MTSIIRHRNGDARDNTLSNLGLAVMDESGRLVAPPQVRPAPSLHFEIRCAWCGVLMEEGPPDAEVSHGMCAACDAKEMAQP
jgi:hypothetical protein